MVIATLLLREDSSNSLKALVEKSQHRKSPLLEYDLQLNSCRLDLVLTSKPAYLKPSVNDEGFESDIDSLSIVSSDDSFTNVQENGSKTTETDSANGSASSDSDTECTVVSQNDSEAEKATTEPEIGPDQSHLKSTTRIQVGLNQVEKSNEDYNQNCVESFNLVDCICYTDVKFPNILVFVIRKEALVFKFDNLKYLQNFYTNFTALKAVTNQKVFNNTSASTKFNLLQRTDNNGITHIEITRETGVNNALLDEADSGPSSIISINTPEDCLDKLINGNIGKDRSQIHSISCRIKNVNQAMSESRCIDASSSQRINNARNPHELPIEKAASTDNLLDINDNDTLVKQNNDSCLGKTWNSAENLLDTPRRPDRKRRVKYKAPQPPVSNQNTEDASKDILSGQFVRVNVNFDPKESSRQLIIKSHLKEPHPKKLQNFSLLSAKPNLPNFLTSKPKLQTYEEFKNSEPKRYVESATLQRIQYKNESSWTNSVPRLLKKQRSKSETRNFTPMAYRYIDTTQSNSLPYSVPVAPQKPQKVNANIFASSSNNYRQELNGFFTTPRDNTQTISNRLFGLSPKLKEFGSSDLKRDRWGSMSELCFRGDNNLKSVIKKDESKKKNEKKVTFSAYTTVQVV